MSGQQQEKPPFETLAFEGFDGGLNTEASRPGIKDNEASWLDGFMPVGDDYLRTIPDVGTSVFNSVPGIGCFFFANLAFLPVCIIFQTDGSVYQCNLDNNAVSEILPPGTISSSSSGSVGITQWASEYIIIVSNQTNGYWIWDGTTTYYPGGSAPGGGTMPTGVSGTTVEIYQGRVFVASGPIVFFSSPESYIDFSSADGGGAFTSFDSFLRVTYRKLIQTNGFLYLIGDSSINYIAGITTGGSPTTTTFTNQNADPETGTPYPATVYTLSSNVIFANAYGAHVSYGGRVSKVSSKLDGVYNTVANLGGQDISGAKHILYGKRIYLMLVPIIDPITGDQVNKMFMWDEKKWWASNQSVSLTFIAGQELNSVLTAYGTDGTHIYPLFTTPSTNYTKTAQSKLWGKPGGYMTAKTVNRVWLVAQYQNTAVTEIDFYVDNETSTTDVALVPASSGLTTGYYVSPPTAIGQVGNLLGITLRTNCADVAIVSASIDAVEVGYRG